jgi:hypothetical protein
MNRMTASLFAGAALFAFGLAGLADAQPRPAAAAQAASPWFGVRLPPPMSDFTKPTVPIGTASLPPYHPFPKGSPLSGETILKDVETIVHFSWARKEAGDPMWGRISGLPGHMATVNWTVDQFKKAGLSDAKVQPFTIPAPQWMPTSWKVEVLGDESFGLGSRTLTLETAFPQPESPSIPGNASITAPMIFVGSGSLADAANVDVKGKIAVIHVTPKPALLYSHELGNAQRLVSRGAVGVINIVESPGNAQYIDPRIGCRDAPCYAVGWGDGKFLEDALGQAAEKGVQIKARVALQSKKQGGLLTANGLAMVKGKSDKNIIINAHGDAWFSGATDNADGLAEMLALAKYYAKRKEKPEHTLVFVVSAGHHGPGNGPNQFIKDNGAILEKNVLFLNIEHTSQVDMINLSLPDPVDGKMVQTWTATVGEVAKKPGVSNMSPFVVKALQDAGHDNGVISASVVSSAVPGDGGAFARFGKPVVNFIGSGIFYHSTADTLGTIPAPALERTAGAFIQFIDKIDHAPESLLDGPVKPGANDVG